MNGWRLRASAEVPDFELSADFGAGRRRALFFAAVVVITMFAAEAFDPRLIWDNVGDIHD